MSKLLWKPVAGYEGIYEVSNTGLVKSLNRKVFYKDGTFRMRKERILRPATDAYGYLHTNLSKDGVVTTWKIHRLVAMAFIVNDDPTHKTTVNHKNEIKTDNRVENLEWMSIADNLAYGTCRERIRTSLHRDVVHPNKEHAPHKKIHRIRTKEHNEKIRKANIGKHSLTEQHLRAMIAARAGKPVHNAKHVSQYTRDMSKIAEYTSIAEASRISGINASSIASVCRNERKTAGNFVWRFTENEHNC